MPSRRRSGICLARFAVVHSSEGCSVMAVGSGMALRGAEVGTVPGAVPIIDIAGYDGGSLADKRAIARRIDEACRTVGFLVVAGHGVPEPLIDRTAMAARAFFDLPVETKLRYGRA